MNSNLRQKEENHILAFGHDPEQRIEFPADSSEHSNGEYAPCHSCYAHFTPEEMGVMATPSAKYLKYKQRLQLCEKCRDKEIDRLVHILGIAPEKSYDYEKIRTTVYVYTVTNGDTEDIANVEKLMFLLEHIKDATS